VGDKPRAYAIAIAGTQNAGRAPGVPGLVRKISPPRHPPPKNVGNPSVRQGQVGSSVPMGNGIRQCHICNSPNHLHAQCPNDTTKVQGTTHNNNSRSVQKVNACQVSSNIKRTRGGYRNRRSHTPHYEADDNSCEVNSDLSNNDSNELTAQESAIAEAAALFGDNSSGYASVNEVVAVAELQPNFDGSNVNLPDHGNSSKQRSASQVVPT